MTQDKYLEVTYRRGKAVAGYLNLPRAGGQKAARSRKVAPGLVVDYNTDDKPIGIEITLPSAVSIQAVNKLLAEFRQQTLEKEELSPLLAG